MSRRPPTDPMRAVVARVAALNFGYFGVELAVAIAIASVSLFADSVDFLEDGSINLLIFLALGWSVAARARVGMVLAGFLVIPGLATLWTAWQNFSVPVTPDATLLTLTGAGALAVNFTCALMLARHREQQGSLSRAAFLSARNDVLANVAIILTGLVTAATLSPWPDLVTGLGLAALNAGAAWEVWEAARAEHRDAAP